MAAAFPEESDSYPRWLREALESEEESPLEDLADRHPDDRAQAEHAPPASAAKPAEPTRHHRQLERRGEAPAPRAAPAGRRAEYRGIDLHIRGSHQIQCEVRIAHAGTELVGSAEGRDVPALRARTAAQATLDALSRTGPEAEALLLQDAQVVSALSGELVVVGVYALGEPEVVPLTGACRVLDSVEHAAVLATLQATNRWIGRSGRQ